jgi:hypothetical protein
MLRGSLSSRKGRPKKGQQRIVQRRRQWLGKSYRSTGGATSEKLQEMAQSKGESTQSKGEYCRKGKMLTKIALQSKEGTIDDRGRNKMS